MINKDQKAGFGITVILFFVVFGLQQTCQAQETAPSCCGQSFVVTGIAGHLPLRQGAVVNGAADPDTYSDQVYGRTLKASVSGLSPGNFTVTIDVAELWEHSAGKRIMDITCEGQTLASGLDVFHAMGYGTAYRITANVAYTGEGRGAPMILTFIGKTGNANFNAIHIKDSLGNPVACVTAKDLRPLEIPGANIVPILTGPKKYTDVSLDPQTRAADLVARMSLAEKVAQMKNGAPQIDRLGVPPYNYWNECLHGVARTGNATVFPEPIAMASSWDPALVHEVADAVSTEARAKYNYAISQNEHTIYHGLTYWTPNINIFRDPRWGRGQETYGEDPFLTSRFAVAFITGLQGNDPHYLKLVATAKHFAVHSGPENQRHQFDARPPDRDLHETYLPQFEAAVREAHVYSIMGAYNALDGEPCCSSSWLLNDLLRNQWGFNGFVVSDCGAITDIWRNHHAVEEKAQAAASAVKAGCDLECGLDYSSLVQAVNEKLIGTADLDRALTRIFTARFRLGMFDPQASVPFSSIAPDQICSPEHQQLAKKIADESLVLLKNSNLLPLDRGTLHKIALVGPNIDTIAALYGNYTGTLKVAPTLLEAFRQKLGSAVQIVPIRGCPYARSIGDFEIIPDICLQHKEGTTTQPGLEAEYFTNQDLQGDPFLKRSDLAIDFWYADTPIIPNYPRHRTSARWTGQLLAPETGSYTIAIEAAEYFRLWLNGKLVINHWESGDQPARTAKIHLKKDQAVDLKLEFAHGSADFARCALMWDRADIDLNSRIVDQAKSADLIVFASGLNGDIEGEEGNARRAIDGVYGDRSSIELPHVQDHLLQALAGVGKPIVLVNFSGSAMAIPWEAEHIPAIVQAWYPGEAGATAVVDLLLGDTAPSGKLPVTFYSSTKDLPYFENYAMAGRTYRYYTGKPLWAFGHGLTYTSFAYSGLTLDKTAVSADETLQASFDLANTGQTDGQDVPQLYIRRTHVDHEDSQHDLRAFQRVAVEKGKTTHLTLSVPVSSLRRWDSASSQYVVDPGTYIVEVGPGSDSLPLSTEFTVR